MRDVILELPPETPYIESKLFEYVSFKKARKTPEHYPIKLRRAFRSNFERSVPVFSPQKNLHSSSQKNVVIKNIGNMKRAHLHNAIAYTIEHSDLQAGFNQLGECVSVNEVLQDWQQDFSTNPNTNEAMHLVFSLNEPHSQSIQDILLESTRQTMQSYFPEYKYILIPHSHQNKPHIHIILNKTHIFSHKKLHFKSKGEVAQFFEELREDFKYNLFEYSRGKLDYTNEVKFDKAFRQEMLNSKINQLEQLSSLHSPQKELDFMASYKEAIAGVNHRINGLRAQIKKTQKSLNNASRHLANIEPKIKERESKNLNADILLQKARDLQAQITQEHQKIEALKTKEQELMDYMRHFLDWEGKFQAFTKHFAAQQKQKAFLSSFKGYERYLSVELNAKLTHLQKDIARNETLVKKDFVKLNEGVLTELGKLKEKSNVFTLKKQYAKLIFYRGIISSLDFSNNASLNDKCKVSIRELAGVESALVEALKKQAQDLPALVKSTIKDLETLQKDTSLDTMAYARAFVELHKKLGFYEKSIVALQSFHKRYGIQLAPQESFKEAKAILQATQKTLDIQQESLHKEAAQQATKAPTIAQKSHSVTDLGRS